MNDLSKPVFHVQLKDVKAGDRFWECGGQGNVECEALTDAEIIEGTIVRCRVKILHSGEEMVFGEKIGTPYGLNLYTAPMYLGVPTLGERVQKTQRPATIIPPVEYEGMTFTDGLKYNDTLFTVFAVRSHGQWMAWVNDVSGVSQGKTLLEALQSLHSSIAIIDDMIGLETAIRNSKES